MILSDSIIDGLNSAAYEARRARGSSTKRSRRIISLCCLRESANLMTLIERFGLLLLSVASTYADSLTSHVIRVTIYVPWKFSKLQGVTDKRNCDVLRWHTQGIILLYNLYSDKSSVRL